MAEHKADWYTDPTGRYQNRYWDGMKWSDQVSNGGPSATDPNPLDPNTAIVPPAPGSVAATVSAPKSVAPPAPAVQVSQKSGGTGFGMILGALVALVAVVLLAVVLLSGSDDSSSTTTTPPATTSAPTTTAGS
ncbi:MAG: DUF2510 domain-containing protein [bacterium]|nr:DUF2510 domain-containing protein [bacterium]